MEEFVVISKKENDRWRDLVDTIDKHKYQCTNCGRKEIIGVQRDKTICSHCGLYIFKDPKMQAKYDFERKLKEKMKNEKM